MTKRIYVVFALFVGLTFGMWTARAATHPPAPYRATAIVKCWPYHLVEDQAAHIKLVDYWVHADGSVTLIYRCAHNY